MDGIRRGDTIAKNQQHNDEVIISIFIDYVGFETKHGTIPSSFASCGLASINQIQFIVIPLLNIQH